MIDIVEIRWIIFERTRRHTYMCMVHGGKFRSSGFSRCQCDLGNKKQYLQDLIVQRPEES